MFQIFLTPAQLNTLAQACDALSISAQETKMQLLTQMKAMQERAVAGVSTEVEGTGAGTSQSGASSENGGTST